MNWQEVLRGELNRCEGRPLANAAAARWNAVQTKGKQGHTASSRHHNMQQAYFRNARFWHCARSVAESYDTLCSPRSSQVHSTVSCPWISLCLSTARIIIVCVSSRGLEWASALSQLPSVAENLPGNLLVCVMRNRRRFIEINTRVLGRAAKVTAERGK
jgi:hypothetical protein